MWSVISIVAIAAHWYYIRGRYHRRNQLAEPKKRGKVPDLEYDVLRERRVEMVNTLVPQNIIPYLKQYNVIDQDDVEKIEKKCKDLRRKGAETMLDIIYNSGNWAFKKLLSALQDAGYQEMAQQLTADLEKKKTEPQSATSTKQRGRMSGIEFDVLRDNRERLLKELDSGVLKNHLFQNKLIDEDDMERITKKEEELRIEGAEEMVTIVLKSGHNAFLGLLKSLHQAGYVDLWSKLNSDLKQKKQEAKIDFPDYSHSPQLKLEPSVANWKQKIAKWKEDDAGKLWCVTMNTWFKDHEFGNIDELKMVVDNWLFNLEEVVEKGCLDCDKINVILDLTKAFLNLDSNNSNFVNDKLIFEDIIKDFVPDFLTTEDKEEFAKSKEAEKQRLHKQQREVVKKLNYNLEGIIEGKRRFDLLPIDAESCELAGYFQYVVGDVRKIWNRLH